MIKAIFFDFDGVLTNFGFGAYNVCFNLHNETGIELEKLLTCYFRHCNGLDTGKISHSDFWEGFCKCTSKKIDISLLDSAFRNTPVNEKMLALSEKLRKNYKVGIITDNTKARFGAIVDEFRLREKFDAIILSADVGSTKKEERIFKVALDALKVKPEECVFIDNSKKNLEIPARMGFKTLFFDFEKKDFVGLIKELSATGVKI
ncbi:MAG: HAD family phosphatase [Nanoarchaeota archaeon]|nr:HAD family phosphatase [Nanoarchaeota archaeon]MBU4300872.1 HAD family phosphatase [Nanoarchaeota archaeon]MBU4451422.1 HAD family phosphatase [Nanoarchaeota archaeon]MCG2724504.1 HAD family phosphatase [archaeon]